MLVNDAFITQAPERRYFWIAASKSRGNYVVSSPLFETVSLKVCLRNSPTIQQFEKYFLRRSIEEMKENPLQQENGDLPGNIYNIKEFFQPKMSLNNREFLRGHSKNTC
jgi:hypothetical protein